MKKFFSVLLIVVLILSMVPTAFAEDNCVPANVTKFGNYTHTNLLEDGENLSGYDKGDMIDFIGENSYIRVVQEGTTGKVYYERPYTNEDSLFNALNCFVYKAGQNVYKVILDSPIKVGECATFDLPTDLLIKVGKKDVYKAQDISHIATFDQCFVPYDDGEYHYPTAWVYTENELNSLSDIKKWGWYIDLTTLDWERQFEIYAGAGNNVIGNGTYVGKLKIVNNNGYYDIQFIEKPYTMVETHIGVFVDADALNDSQAAPGQFKNDIPISAGPEVMAVHFTVQLPK